MNSATPLPSLVLITLLCLGCLCSCAQSRRDRGLEPPALPREMRAAWVATVANIDWPSERGLPVEQQQEEMIAILDKAVDLNLNVIILQVRTSADALYNSRLEPWSEYLTGEQGRPPEPYYDPLQMWIDEAHARGIELHAWFNPFRARMPAARTPNHATHISQTHPHLVHDYGRFQWMDPGEPAAREHTLRVFLDVVRRYDVDGIHIDDYFYPYPVNDEEGNEIPFPDDVPWQRYTRTGGRLERDDWRRENINVLVQRIYEETKREKRHVKFGISPFGIYRPGIPEGIEGFDQYDKLYADARLWFNRGWCDYYTPQLYWPIEQTPQAYPVLLEWWVGENNYDRHLVPGNFTSRVADRERNWPAEEILNQIRVTREQEGAVGNVHFSMRALMENRDGLSDRLMEDLYAEPAIVLAATWLDRRTPASPGRPRLEATGDGVRVMWQHSGRRAARQFAIQALHGDQWRLHVVPAHLNSYEIRDHDQLGRARAVWISSVDRLGNASRPVRAR
jgi:uncharacterized lipoprotein YddW (UPF0748 family)